MAEMTKYGPTGKKLPEGVWRKGNRYVVIWRHRGKQHKEFFATLADAREAKGRRAAGDRRKVRRIRFEEYAPTWLENYVGRTERGFSETTRERYRQTLESLLIPHWRGVLLDDIDAQDVKQMFSALERKGVTADSIKKAKAVLSALMSTALEERMIRVNPVYGVRYVPSANVKRKPSKTQRALTRQELRRVFANLEPEWVLFFELLAQTGMRVSEAIGLCWTHVHLGDDAHLEIREQFYKGERKALKSNHSRRDIPLSAGMARRLTEWRDASDFRSDYDPVFATAIGTPWTYSNLLNRVLIPARDAAGVPWAGFHAFRKACGSLLHEIGKTDRQLCDWLGHHDPAFSVRYYVTQMDEGLGSADFFDELVLDSSSADGGGNAGATGDPQSAETVGSLQAQSEAELLPDAGTHSP